MEYPLNTPLRPPAIALCTEEVDVVSPLSTRHRLVIFCVHEAGMAEPVVVFEQMSVPISNFENVGRLSESHAVSVVISSNGYLDHTPLEHGMSVGYVQENVWRAVLFTTLGCNPVVLCDPLRNVDACSEKDFRTPSPVVVDFHELPPATTLR